MIIGPSIGLWICPACGGGSGTYGSNVPGLCQACSTAISFKGHSFSGFPYHKAWNTTMGMEGVLSALSNHDADAVFGFGIPHLEAARKSPIHAGIKEPKDWVSMDKLSKLRKFKPKDGLDMLTIVTETKEVVNSSSALTGKAKELYDLMMS